MAALGLARSHPEQCEEAIPELLRLVDGQDEALARAARAELARIGRHHLPILLGYFAGTEEASTEFRSALREALVAAGGAAVEPLRTHLFDGGASNPRELGEVLVDIGAEAVAPLVADLDSPDARRRVCSAWIVGRMGRRAAGAAPALATRLEHDVAPVAGAAALALAEVAPLEDSTRAALEGALARRAGEIGAPVREALARLWLARAAHEGAAASSARLFALGAESLVPAVEGCASAEPATRAAAQSFLRARFSALVLGLGMPGDGAPRTLARLQSALEDRDPGTRARAAFDIAALGARGEGFLFPLAAHVHDPHAGAAFCARLALLACVRGLALGRGKGAP